MYKSLTGTKIQLLIHEMANQRELICRFNLPFGYLLHYHMKYTRRCPVKKQQTKTLRIYYPWNTSGN